MLKMRARVDMAKLLPTDTLGVARHCEVTAGGSSAKTLCDCLADMSTANRDER